MLENTVLANTDDIPWEDAGEGQGAFRVKYLQKSAETGSYTALIDMPPGWRGAITTPKEHAREWLMLDGSWKMADGSIYHAGAYYHGPAGTEHPTVAATDNGCRAITWMIATPQKDTP